MFSMASTLLSVLKSIPGREPRWFGRCDCLSTRCGGVEEGHIPNLPCCGVAVL